MRFEHEALKESMREYGQLSILSMRFFYRRVAYDQYLNRNFQFSLWDSWHCRMCSIKPWPSLSWLSILSMRFTRLLNALQPASEYAFQFSLWDSHDILKQGRYALRVQSTPISFNSLYEILSCPRLEGGRSGWCRAFNSLYEILPVKYTFSFEEGIGGLSILSMRFVEGQAGRDSYQDNLHLSILSMRFIYPFCILLQPSPSKRTFNSLYEIHSWRIWLQCYTFITTFQFSLWDSQIQR